MIIDRILDRYDNEKDNDFNYNAHDFYYSVFEYGRIGHDITRAMDAGSEDDTRRALCDYIRKNGYNAKIIDYINNRVWNENTSEKRKFIDILED